MSIYPTRLFLVFKCFQHFFDEVGITLMLVGSVVVFHFLILFCFLRFIRPSESIRSIPFL
nr:MAG TPA: Oxaloacetate decarboxylase, gamma chain [Caudoviricetes sp.]